MSQRSVTILGSTGSIGTQALQVIERYPEELTVHALVCNSNGELLAQQARKFRPKVVVLNDPKGYKALAKSLADTDIKVLSGADAVCEVAGDYNADIVLTAMVGFAGLAPTIRAIEAGRTIALANKETLVVAGELIRKLSRKYVAPILPVDSEHSAIFQCIHGESNVKPMRIYLTASGGPFVDRASSDLDLITPEEALQHPNWSMGKKVTIDSATLMNKGFEMIEAKWLFGVEPEDIEVLVHRQSLIHSMVGFADGSVKAQLSLPDMRIPISYALLFPGRKEVGVRLPSVEDLMNLTFERPRREDFKCLDLAYEAVAMGGTAPCVLNAANEVAVERYLSRKGVGFCDIPALIHDMMDHFGSRTLLGLEQLEEIDRQVRERAWSWSKR